MVEEIITALSRITWLFVIAHGCRLHVQGPSSRRKAGRPGIGRALCPRRLGAQDEQASMHISAQLIDAATGAHLSAERFDGLLEDIFELQDKVASTVAGVIEPTLEAAETARGRSRPTTDLTAYDLFLRARCGTASVIRARPGVRGTRPAPASDRARPAVWSGSRFCGALSPIPGGDELHRKSGGGPTDECRTGATSTARRPRRSRRPGDLPPLPSDISPRTSVSLSG